MWQDYENFTFGTFGDPKFTKDINLILYDLDNTVIMPDEKVRPGAPYNKWKFIKGAKERIQKDASDALIIFVSNQLNLSDYIDKFKKKIEDVMQQLSIPALFYAASGQSSFRKPSTDIFTEHLLPLLKQKGVTTIKSIIYVGDAAGRKGDFGDTDRKFLYNIHLLLSSKINPIKYDKVSKFKTPEEYFQNKQAESFKWDGIDPKKIMDDILRGKKPSEIDTSLDEHFDDTQEMILMIGPPASGKSTIAKKIAEHGYIRINQDELKSKAKVIKAIQDALKQGKSVVVDNTNLDPTKRAEIIKIAQKYFSETDKPVKIRAFHINGDWDVRKQVEFAKHLNVVRQRLGGAYIKEIAYRVLLKNFEPPKEEEGFTEIINIPFIPRFKNAKHLLAFLQRS